MGTIKTTNIEPIADNGTVTLGSSGDTFTVPSGVTVNMSSATQTGVGGTTAPYVGVYRNGDQNLSDNTLTVIEFNVENVDSASAFDTSTYRFTPQTSGYYFVSLNVGVGNTIDNHYEKVQIKIYKNGSSAAPGAVATRDWDPDGIHYNDQINTSTIVQLNGSSDYIDGRALVDVSSGTPRIESGQASMQIFKMTE